MAGISTQINMIDNLTPVLQTQYTAMMQVNSAFDTASGTMSGFEWVSPPAMEFFSGNDLDRFKLEMDSANSMLARMNATQQSISEQAAAMNIFPPNALSDISNMGARIAGLQSQIEAAQNSRIEAVGVRQANVEMEELRRQISDAVNVQDSMNAALRNMDASGASVAYARLNNIVNDTERNIRDNINEQAAFNEEIANGENAASGLKKMLAGVVGVFTVRAAVGWMRQAVNTTNENIRVEQRLASVMANRGATYEEFVALQQRAAQIQQNSAISGTSMMGAANELARYVGSVEAIEVMMDSLADFASGTGNVFGATVQDMASYAQYFTQAMAGNYRMLERRAGVHLTETQKQVIRYGNDMQRALMIQEVVNQSWGGLAEQMAQTPEGMQVAISNAISDIRSNIGAQLMPVVMVLFRSIQNNMPQIERSIRATIPIIQAIVGLLVLTANAAFSVSDVIANNWGWIQPTVLGIAGALTAWKIATVALATYKRVLTINLIALNTAIKANPIGLLVMLIAGAIAATIAWINRIGGLHMAWLYLTSSMLTTWDWLRIGFLSGVYWVIDSFIWFEMRLTEITTSIVDSFADMRLNALEHMQSMAQDIIGPLNNLIEARNRFMPSWLQSDTIELTFATQMRYDNTAERQARNAAMEQRRAEIEAGIEARATTIDHMRQNAGIARAERLAEIEALRASQESKDYGLTHTDFLNMNFYGEGFGTLGQNVSDIAANTGEMANISGENLKYWRDIAERDYINRFTTARVNLQIAGISNTINYETDLKDVVDYIVEETEEALLVAAERVNDYHGAI